MFNIFKSQEGSSTPIVLSIVGTLAGASMLNQAVGLNTEQGNSKLTRDKQIAIQHNVSALAQLKSKICDGSDIQVEDGKLESEKYTMVRDSLLFPIEIIEGSDEFDKVFAGQNVKSTFHTTKVAMLGSNDNRIDLKVYSKVGKKTYSSVGRIECDSSPALSDSEFDEELGPDEFVTKEALGIGFEDWYDNDYNDLVACFEGQFKVDQNTGVFTSLNEQRVDTFSKRNSSQAGLFLRIVDVDSGKLLSLVASLGRKQEITKEMKFKKGQKFTVLFKDSRKFWDRKAVLEKDSCRTSGN